MNLSYQDTFKTQQKKALASLAVKPNEEPVSAVEAWALTEALGFEPEYVRVLWPKLARRPARRVRECSREVREARPEQRQGIITDFAKKHPAIPREKRSAKL